MAVFEKKRGPMILLQKQYLEAQISVQKFYEDFFHYSEIKITFHRADTHIEVIVLIKDIDKYRNKKNKPL